MKQAFIALVLIVAVAAPVLADNANGLRPGPVWGHLSDWSSLYRSGVPYRDALPAIGDEGRALAYVNQFYDANTGQVLWTPGDDELTVLEYDFVIPGGDCYQFDFATYYSSGVMQYVQVSDNTGGIIPTGGTYTLYFVPGEEGGRIDIWRDTTPDWNTYPVGQPAWSAGPTAWVDNIGTYDDYPLASDVMADGTTADPSASLWLTGTYADLFADLNNDGRRQGAEPILAWFDQNENGIYEEGTDLVAVYQIYAWAPGGTGTAYAYVDFTGGSFLGSIDQDALGDGYDLSLTVDLHPSRYGSRGTWGTRSSDPTYMEVIPEPSTLGLLGTGLVGLVGFIRRKRA